VETQGDRSQETYEDRTQETYGDRTQETYGDRTQETQGERRCIETNFVFNGACCPEVRSVTSHDSWFLDNSTKKLRASFQMIQDNSSIITHSIK
jgi:hypothetical protein